MSDKRMEIAPSHNFKKISMYSTVLKYFFFEKKKKKVLKSNEKIGYLKIVGYTSTTMAHPLS